MASITERKNGTFRIAVSNGRDINGKQIIETTTFKFDDTKTKRQNEKALEKFVIEFETRVKEGKLLSGEKLTLKKYADTWLKDYAGKQYELTTIEQTTEHLNKIILPCLGHYKLAEIKPLHIQGLYDTLLSNGYNASSIRRYHNIISSMLNTAVYWQLIESNPCSRVKPPKLERNTDVKHFTLEEAQAFLEYLEKPYQSKHGGRGEKMLEAMDERKEPLQLKALFNLAILGGFRRGELLALTWSDIDFEKCVIDINKSLAKTKSTGVIIKTTKNKSSDRLVSVPEECIRLLKEVRAEQRINWFAAGESWQGKGNVFYQADGSYMDISTPNHSLQRIIKRYNKEHEEQLPVIPFHGLRHTSATLLISQNNDIKTVSARLGHADVSTTLDIYTHALKKRDEEASKTLEILFKKRA